MNSTMPGTIRPRLGNAPRSGLVVWLLMVAVIVLASHLRLQASLDTQIEAPLRADAGEYFSYAYNLRYNGVYSRAKPDAQLEIKPDAVRSPGYPIFLSALIDETPSHSTLLKIVLVQALLGVGVTLLVFFLARGLMSPGFAILAALFVAISPHLVNAGVYILSETLFTFCVIVLMCVLANKHLQEKPVLLLTAGLVLGVCALVRPTMLYFPVFLGTFFFLSWSGKAATKATVLLLLGMALAYGPWVARNVIQIGATSDPTLQIHTLHHGHYPGFMYQDDPATRGYPYRYDPRAHEVTSSMESVTDEIISRFRDEPAKYLHWYVLEKPYYLWSWFDMQGQPVGSFTYLALQSPYYTDAIFKGTFLLAQLLHWPLIICGFAFGLFVWLPTATKALGKRAVYSARLCALLLVYVTALHMVGAPFSRYSIPFLPELYIMAVGGLCVLSSIWRARLTHKNPLGVGV